MSGIKLIKIIAGCTLCLFLFTICSYAHSGKTDYAGGHYNNSTGEYHYHHGYSAHSHYDMDGDGEDEAAVNCYGGSGTGVSLECLYVVEKNDDGSLSSYGLTGEALAETLDRLTPSRRFGVQKGAKA